MKYINKIKISVMAILLSSNVFAGGIKYIEENNYINNLNEKNSQLQQDINKDLETQISEIKTFNEVQHERTPPPPKIPFINKIEFGMGLGTYSTSGRINQYHYLTEGDYTKLIFSGEINVFHKLQNSPIYLGIGSELSIVDNDLNNNIKIGNNETPKFLLDFAFKGEYKISYNYIIGVELGYGKGKGTGTESSTNGLTYGINGIYKINLNNNIGIKYKRYNLKFNNISDKPTKTLDKIMLQYIYTINM